jgi:hypothetical protein
VDNVGFYRKTGTLYIVRVMSLPPRWIIGALVVQEEELKSRNGMDSIDALILIVTEISTAILFMVVFRRF